MINPTILTESEIADYSEQLKDYPKAIEALNTVQKCGGNLEEAFEKIMCEISEKTPGLYPEIDEIAEQIKSESTTERAIEQESPQS